MGRQQFTFYNFNYLFHDGGQIISFYMTGTSVIKESKIEKLFHLQLRRVMQVVIKQSLLHNYKDNQYLHNISANNYLFKVNKRNTRKRFKICSKLTIKTLGLYYLL